MKNDVVPVQIRGILPANSGCALFVGNDEKVFVINVEPQMGAVIGDVSAPRRPRNGRSRTTSSTAIFQGFGISVERVVITDLKNSTYFARLILQQQNEVRPRKIVEIGRAPERLPGHRRRAEKADFCRVRTLFEQVEDMSEVLDQINETGSEPPNKMPAAKSPSLALICGDDEFAVKQRAKQIYQQWSDELGGMDHEIIEASVSQQRRRAQRPSPDSARPCTRCPFSAPAKSYGCATAIFWATNARRPPPPSPKRWPNSPTN